MQLDNTQVAVRERGMMEILDLALHVLRAYWLPLTGLLALGVAPLLVLNYFLVGWLANVEYSEIMEEDAAKLFRYAWTMSMLIAIEAPLATVFATSYLGQAVFLAKPSLRSVVIDVVKLAPRLFWCLFTVRGIAAAWLLLLLLDETFTFNPLADLAFAGLAFYALALRSARPFMNEIVLLERNPLRSTQTGAMTIGRRSALLHNPSSGDLIARSIGTGLVAILLAYMVTGTGWALVGGLTNDFNVSPGIVHIVFPVALWIVVGYLMVVRFLCYLDLRIRQEGWEVELRLRAEAGRMAAKLT